MTEGPILVRREGAIAHVTIARPEVHNAFDAATILALGAAFEAIGADERVRAIVLTGAGPAFSAGGDLRWMRESAAYTIEENAADAERLAMMLERVDRVPKPVVARVHGTALGGGTGLLAACDVVLASERAVFGFSEVRLGLIPAVISPFLVRRIGEARARALMLTGERFDAARALAIGLIDEVHPHDQLDAAVAAKLDALCQGGPDAHASIKRLVRAVAGKEPEAVRSYTARMIAEARAGAEGAEGVSAFLEKRTPAWRPTER